MLVWVHRNKMIISKPYYFFAELEGNNFITITGDWKYKHSIKY